MRRIKREDEKGAMGVGTLIVFIAMVLVAAVAASVLIDTANKLQQQAEQTGDQAIREVSTAFQVHDVFGYNAAGDNKIENLTLKVGLAAGAPSQDLNQTVVQVSGPSSEANLLAVDSDNYDLGEGADSDSYAIDNIIEQEDGGSVEFSDVRYLEQGDLVNITIAIDETSVGGPGTGIGPQTDLSIQIMPKHGTPTYEEITTPPVMTTKIVDLN